MKKVGDRKDTKPFLVYTAEICNLVVTCKLGKSTSKLLFGWLEQPRFIPMSVYDDYFSLYKEAIVLMCTCILYFHNLVLLMEPKVDFAILQKTQ